MSGHKRGREGPSSASRASIALGDVESSSDSGSSTTALFLFQREALLVLGRGEGLFNPMCLTVATN